MDCVLSPKTITCSTLLYKHVGSMRSLVDQVVMYGPDFCLIRAFYSELPKVTSSLYLTTLHHNTTQGSFPALNIDRTACMEDVDNGLVVMQRLSQEQSHRAQVRKGTRSKYWVSDLYKQRNSQGGVPSTVTHHSGMRNVRRLGFHFLPEGFITCNQTKTNIPSSYTRCLFYV